MELPRRIQLHHHIDHSVSEFQTNYLHHNIHNILYFDLLYPDNPSDKLYQSKVQYKAVVV
jgi:hypothetical protein